MAWKLERRQSESERAKAEQEKRFDWSRPSSDCSDREARVGWERRWEARARVDASSSFDLDRSSINEISSQRILLDGQELGRHSNLEEWDREALRVRR